MEPIRLQLRNFAHYRDATLDFRPVSAAAVVGPNGAGKSSLVDGLLWALYGESTKGGPRALDQHVTRGESECLVTLEFQLHGQTYRVIRGRSIARNKSTLEFAVQDGAEWRALGGKTLGEVQVAIEQTLRMDYRTFTASSVILQGKSDSFTADMTDAERKEALARILGLDLWDRVQEAAKGRLREVKASLARIDSQARQHREAVANRAALIEQIRLDNDALGEAQTALTTAEARAVELEAQLAQRPLLERHQSEAREAEQRARARVREAEREAAAAEAESRRVKAEAEQEIMAADAAIQRLQGLLARREEIDQAAACEADVAQDVAGHERRAQQWIKLADDAATKERHVAAYDRGAESEIARLTAELKAAESQAGLLDEVPCSGAMMESCKLLGAARAAASRRGSISERLIALHNTANPHVDTWQAVVRARDAIGYDPEAHQAAKAMLEELRQTARLQPALEAADLRMAELCQRKQQVADACWQRLGDLGERRRKARDAHAEAEREAAAALERTVEVSQQLTALEPAQRDLVAAKTRRDDARALEAGLRQALGRLEAELAACDRASAAQQALEAEAARARDQDAVYSLLEQAASKRGGVPALIIEAAVPEIERLANAILARLAGGRLQVRLDTQVEGKTTGTLQEVLRITICDQGADRPYPTYSGAERFLVDLALRVALSKFLAHRAGAEIQLFVLDEGIACCDPANREAVMGAIQAVSQEFRKVLVVTHLEELKDAFPRRLEVVRGHDGSHVKVVA